MRNISIALLCAVFLTVVCAGHKQAGFSIKGVFDSSRGETDSIFIYSGESIIARAAVVNGSFELRGTVAEPALVTLYTRAKGESLEEGTGAGRILLENAAYSYEYKQKNVKIKGGQLHDLVLGFESTDEYHQAVDDYMNALNNVFENKPEGYEPTPEENKLLGDKMTAAIDIESIHLASVIEGSESSLLAKAFALFRTQDWPNYPIDHRLELLDNYLLECKSEIDKRVIAKLHGVYGDMKKADDLNKEVSAGKPFKDIEAKDTDGNIVKLSDIIEKNKYTILEFWASWCGPCRGEIPNLKKAYEKYQSKGMEIYSISLDEKQDKWLKALQEEQTTWINVVDNLGFKGAPSKAYGIQGVPASFLIDQDGKIIAVGQELRGGELDKTLRRFIK